MEKQKMSKKKKIVIIVSAVVIFLFLITFGPNPIRTVRNIGKIKYIVNLLTGQSEEEDISVEELIEAFVDKSNPPIYRKYAAEKIGHAIKDPAAVEPFIKVMQDKTENELIRKEAAFTLGLIGDPRAINALVEALNDEPIRRKAIKALTMIEDERIIEPLLEIVKTGNTREKSTAALGLKVDRPEIVRALVDLIKNEPKSRYCAAKSLGETRTKDEEAFHILLDIVVSDKYIDESYGSGGRDLLISTAILALGKIEDKRAVEPLLKILEEDRYFYRHAAIALGDIRDRRAIEPLKKRMEEKKDEEWIMKDLNEAYRKLTER